MVTLSADSAVELVRKNLDELDPNGNASVMYTDEYSDNESLSSLIMRFLPEAINAVHMNAPVQLLEGEAYTFAASDVPAGETISYGSTSTDADYCVLHFSLATGTADKFLRLVAFQAVDSHVVVTDIIGEATPEGRKQLNKHIRGRYDRPRLVQRQGKHTAPSFDYYSLKESTVTNSTVASSCVSQLSFIKEQFYTAPTVDNNVTTYPSYNISRRLRQNIIDCTTAMVMETYNDQRAQSYYQKANNFSII